MKNKVLLTFALICGFLMADAQINPVQIGRASNAFTILRTSQNQVIANDDLNLVAFIHRQDVSIWGGGAAENGKFRYDLSIDGGATFTTDIGVMNPVYTRPSRYPNMTIFRPTASLNPFDAKFVYGAATLDATWDGHVSGLSSVTNSAVTGTENYDFQGTNTLIPGSICEGLPGEFWMLSEGLIEAPKLYIYKGLYSPISTDINWTLHDSVVMNLQYNSLDAFYRSTSANIAFSPDGTVGWIGLVGDIIGGHDSAYSPILIKSSDGGATWGTPVEVDLRNVGWINNSLTSYYLDVNGVDPAGSGVPTTGFDCDITVDNNGDAHLVTSIWNKSYFNDDPATPEDETQGTWSVLSSLEGFIIDVQSVSGGTSYDAKLISNLYSFRGAFGNVAPADQLSFDNYLQISRNTTGDRIFYSWTDSQPVNSDCAISTNNSPDLRIAASRVSDGFQVPPKYISSGDFVFGGNILAPTMSPITLTNATDYNLPIVFMQMLQDDPLAACQFWYVGNDAEINESEFVQPSTAVAPYADVCNCVAAVPSINYSNPGGLVIDFFDASLNFPTSWAWDFGDGNTSNLPNPQHTYATSGFYQVCLTVNNGCGPQSVCENLNVICSTPSSSFLSNSNGLIIDFTDFSTNNPFSWNWDFGDGTFDNSQNPQHTYGAPGTYQVCLTVDNGCGIDVFCQTLTATCAIPDANYFNSASGLQVSFMDNSFNAPTQWTWDFGDGNFSGQQNPVHTFASGGVYQVCLTATNPCGADTSCQSIIVNCVPPVADFTGAGNGLIIDFVDNTSGGATTWSWNFGDGTSSALQNPQHTFPAPGPYNVCLTSSNACGSDVICYNVNTVCTMPISVFSATDNGLSVQFTDNSLYSPTQWNWDFGDGNISTAQNPNYVYATEGTYTVCLEAENACGQTTYCNSVTISCPLPVPNFVSSAAGLSFTFGDISQNNPTSWSWDFGDGYLSNLQNPQHTFDVPGNYDVCLTVISDCGSADICQQVTVVCTAPLAEYAFGSSDLAVAFTDISQNGATSWSWDFGDGSTSAQQNPTHTYNAPGTYNVCMTASSICGSDQFCMNVIVTCASPTALFLNNGAGLAITFQDISVNSPVIWNWDFGDGTTSMDASPVHTYLNTGTYNVCLYVENGCGADSICQQVVTSCAAPVADFVQLESGLQVNFQDGSTNGPSSWSWNFGDGNSSIEQNPEHTYATPGTYGVCLTANSICGSNTTCHQVTVACAAPSSGFSFTQGITLDLNFMDTSTGGAANWNWDFGDGNSSTDQNPNHTFAQDGTYLVCLTIDNICGTDGYCQLINVVCQTAQPSFLYQMDGPQVDFMGETLLTPDSWAWTFGDGSTDATQNPQHEYADTGAYTVCLTVENVCGPETKCQTIHISCLHPEANFAYTANTQTVQFTDMSSGYPESWVWDFGDGNQSTLAEPTYTFDEQGLYTICLTVQNSCSADTFCSTDSITWVGIEGIIAGSRFEVYPNPNNGDFFVKMDLRHGGTLDFELVDVIGRKLHQESVKASAGHYVKEINTAALSEGVYFLQVASDEQTVVKKIMIK